MNDTATYVSQQGHLISLSRMANISDILGDVDVCFHQSYIRIHISFYSNYLYSPSYHEVADHITYSRYYTWWGHFDPEMFTAS